MTQLPASGEPLPKGPLGGLARALATPVYLKQLAAEPWVKKLVPFLVVVFLGAIWAGALVQMQKDRRDALVAAKIDLDHVAALAAMDMKIAQATLPPARRSHADLLAMALPDYVLDRGRVSYALDSKGMIVASRPENLRRAHVDELFGKGQPVTILADRAGVQEIELPNGEAALATVRTLGRDIGSLAIVQPVQAALAPWRTRAISVGLLAAASTLVIATLALAFHQQTWRATEADSITAGMGLRIDAVLNSGRAGLWDWNLDRGRVFWSDSLHALLGRERESEFLSISDIERLVHPGDQSLFTAARELDKLQGGAIGSEFRLRHARGHWVWIRAQGEVIQSGAAKHFVGIAIDITEQKELAAARSAADRRLRDAIEGISEGFALYEPNGAPVLANSKFREIERHSP
ncbi:MAG: PAS domain-containing protein, partial [Beijerinckiaceae bacterium]